MIRIPNVRKKKYGVFGLGVSGLATAEALAASGAAVYAWDESEAARARTTDTEFRAEHPKAWPWPDLEALVVSPGVPLTHPAPHVMVKKAHQTKTPVIGDTELFARAVNARPPETRPKIVAVTGSNGKSTVTALIAHILRECGVDVVACGNIGAAALAAPALDEARVYVLEMSSFQLDLTHSLRADAAVFLNLSPDHLDRHGDVEGYFAAKKRIFLNQASEDLAVIAVDDRWGERLRTEFASEITAPRVAPISARAVLSEGVFAIEGKLHYVADGKTHAAGSLEGAPALRGAHGALNAAAAIAVARDLELAPALAMKAAKSFPGLAHRLEEVATLGKTRFINDSKATNVDATQKAIDSYRDIFWICGGRAKAGGLGDLPDRAGAVRRAFLIGEAAEPFAEALKGKVRYQTTGGLERAVAAAWREAEASDAPAPVVLFSPAAASFDQYRNFEERGEAFRAAVAALGKKRGEAA